MRKISILSWVFNRLLAAFMLFSAVSSLLLKKMRRLAVFTSLNFFGYQGEYVTEQGNYEMFAANDVSIGIGKYLVLWKKTPAGWKMYRDMFNSNTPVARPAK